MNKRFVGFGAAVLLCANAMAQEDLNLLAQNGQKDSVKLQQLDEVVVSDSRFDIKRENSGKTVIKITAQELERNQGKTVTEIINTKSGIEIAGSRGRDGSVLGVFARGGRGRQVLVLIDGVRVTDPSSFSPQYDLRLLAIGTIESIEIIKGAASTLYGTNAATAVISITTKKSAQDKIAGNFKSTVGTNQNATDENYNLSSFENSAQISGTLNKFNYRVGITNRYSDGLSAAITPENAEDPFSSYSADLRMGYKFSDTFMTSVYANKTNYYTAFDAALAEAPNLFRQDQERVGLSSVFKYNKGSLHLNTAFTEYTSDTKNSFGESITNGKNVVLDLYNKYIFAEKWHTVFGINYIKDDAIFAQEADFTILDPYVNTVFVSGRGLNLNLGGRLNTHSEYGNNFVYNLNPSYTLSTNDGYLKFLGSYATSYITPALTQLFGDFGANPELEPEENRTIEGGVEYALNNIMRLSVLYFNRNEKNTIGFDQNFTSINVAEEIDVQGIETEISWTPNKNIDFNLNYTFTDRTGDNAIRIPKHKVNASLGYALSNRTNASLTYQYTGERVDTDFSQFPSVDISLRAFSLVNLYLEHRLCDQVKVFVNAENLLNEDFIEVIGFTTRGRNISAGFSLDL